jgi:hypothetical protein
MKKMCFILTLLLLLNMNIFSEETDSQETDKKFTLQASPLLYMANFIFYGTPSADDPHRESPRQISFIMDIEGQYKIKDKMNVSLAAAFYIMDYQWSNSGNTTFQMIFKPMFIYRPLGTGLKGFYLGFHPTIGWYLYKSWDDYVYEYDDYANIKNLAAVVGFGFNIGYKWVFPNGFTLQLGTGIGKTWDIPRPMYYGYPFNADGSFRLTNFDIQILDLKLGYSF